MEIVKRYKFFIVSWLGLISAAFHYITVIPTSYVFEVLLNIVYSHISIGGLVTFSFWFVTIIYNLVMTTYSYFRQQDLFMYFLFFLVIQLGLV